MTLDVQDSQYKSGGASKTITYLLFTACSYRYTFVYLSFSCDLCHCVTIMRPHAPQHTHLNVEDFLKIKRPACTYALPGISIERCFSINDPNEIPFENLNKRTLPPRHASNVVVRYQGFGTRFCDKSLMSHPCPQLFCFDILPSYVIWALRHHWSKEDLKYLERTLSFSSDSTLSWRRFPMPLKLSRNQRISSSRLRWRRL